MNCSCASIARRRTACVFSSNASSGERFKIAGCAPDPSCHRRGRWPATLAFHEAWSSRRTSSCLPRVIWSRNTAQVPRVAARRVHAYQVMTPEPSPPPPRFDFRPGLPDLSLFPRRSWTNSMQRALTAAPDGALYYPDPRGVELALVSLSTYRIAREPPYATGSRDFFQRIGAVDRVLCRVFRDRGVRAVAVVDPGHTDQCTDIAATGLETPRIPVDAAGLCVDRLAQSGAEPCSSRRPTSIRPERCCRRSAVRRCSSGRNGRAYSSSKTTTTPNTATTGSRSARSRGSRPTTLSTLARPARSCHPHSVFGGSCFRLLWSRTWFGRSCTPIAGRLLRTACLRRFSEPRRTGSTSPAHAFDLPPPAYSLVTALNTRLRRFPIQGIAAGLHFMIELERGLDEETVVAAAALRSVRVYAARSYRANPRKVPLHCSSAMEIPESAIPEGVAQLAAAIAHCPSPIAHRAAANTRHQFLLTDPH